MTQSASTRPEAAKPEKTGSGWSSKVSWGIAIIMVALMVLFVLTRMGVVDLTASTVSADPAVDLPNESMNVALPAYAPASGVTSLARLANIQTIISEQGRDEPITYTVQSGDLVFGIATQFDLHPELVLWSNYDVLHDDPQSLSIGQNLLIPPIDGLLYTWADGDTIEKVAEKYKTTADKILLYPGNHLDLVNPQIKAGTMIMVPDGQRELQTWVVPTIPRGPAGVNVTIIGPGACDTSAGGAYGTGTFVWPANQHVLSGNDFWSGHLGIDIAALTGDPVYAADSGVVVYAGAISGGYGNMVMIDHGNGYQTLYAHLSVINVSCGASVYQGQVIARSGSTGNSTGPHLHFEVRFMGGFINPWYVLP